ncbi:MAG: LPS export ABC transporter periplasmic protein LptC [Acidobacteriaceae bacterium]|nr:LPS export ABC transporter periplasmic protein LptC [Acidobacteriaceae bacterium]
MRWTRPVLLIAIFLIVISVGTTFYGRWRDQKAGAASKPKVLAGGLTASSQAWEWTQSSHGKPVVSIHADDMSESEGKLHLRGVELHLFHKEATEYDDVKSAKAEFDEDKGLLFSEGEVEITMSVPADQKDAKPSGRLMHIKSSGVTFESKTGKASTDKPTTFDFDRGSGNAVGATYDPEIHELHMNSQVHLLWTGNDPKKKPMQVEAGDATYKEKDQRVFLGQWSKLVRDTLTLNAGPATVNLDKGIIQQVTTEHANGQDVRPNRQVDYAADQLTINMDQDGQIKNILGEQNARLVSHSNTGETTITTDHIDLGFDTQSGDSILDTALATGHSVAESKPAVKQGSEPADTRVLRSEVIRTKMKPDGQEIDNVETAGAGSLEFIPNAPAKPHRWLDGDKLWIKYGEKNQLESCKSINVATKTQKPTPAGKKEPLPPSLTWSKNLLAEFDPKTAQLSRLEQWDDFRYEEGTRKAKANRALLEQSKNLIHLTGVARVWDPTGLTDGDTIVLDQANGDFSAEGNVSSTRMPDKKKETTDAEQTDSGGLLADDQPMHAKAKKMISKDNNLQIRYEGDAVAWQDSNRLQADVIEIDRENNILKAHGHVVSQLLDKPKDDKKKKTASPVFTIVKSPELIYNDDDRLAHYTGGVLLDRPDMKVKSQELKAYLRDADDDDASSLHHAFADGKVEVVQRSVDRTRTGTSEHAEYYVDEAKVILENGHPQLVDTIKGSTRGRKLTWFSNDDRLLVDGAEGQPAQSKLRRK